MNNKINERPMLFNSEMVRAILSGQKTVTRREIKHQPGVPVTDAIPRRNAPHGPATADWYWRPKHGHLNEAPSKGWDFKCPYGEPGDRLWVRETWQLHEKFTDNCVVVYRANERNSWTEFHRRFPVALSRGISEKPFQYGWRPSIHMPRWASRILLEITDVRVERLQEITYEQAVAEGVHRGPLREWSASEEGGACHKYPVPAFRDLWQSTGGNWNANPWVWVVEFNRVIL